MLYIAHQFQGHNSQAYALYVGLRLIDSHLCLFFIRETKCCTCVITGGRGHTVSAESGGHTAGYIMASDIKNYSVSEISEIVIVDIQNQPPGLKSAFL